MNVYYITFRSVTPAQRGERALAGAGLRAALVRTPRWMEERGCGYCLRLRCPDIDGLIGILRQKGIDFRRVYRQRGDGTLEEVQL